LLTHLRHRFTSLRRPLKTLKDRRDIALTKVNGCERWCANQHRIAHAENGPCLRVPNRRSRIRETLGGIARVRVVTSLVSSDVCGQVFP
jgi:hypothetical protein